jgi:hypothetical protein
MARNLRSSSHAAEQLARLKQAVAAPGWQVVPPAQESR